jgi:hypothetical protein
MGHQDEITADRRSIKKQCSLARADLRQHRATEVKPAVYSDIPRLKAGDVASDQPQAVYRREI